MKTNEEIRNLPHIAVLYASEDGGMGEIRFSKWKGTVIWSNGGGWDHVSVRPFNSRLIPSWEEMCKVKDLFFYEDEVVVQYHPAKDQYVNNVKNCLHLWRPQNLEMPTPPSIFVGIRDGQSTISAMNEIITALESDETAKVLKQRIKKMWGIE